jgi:glycosyltransferase involved in cell wall biosynthesis
MIQEFDSYEVILVDDGSMDCSSEICDSYVSEDDRFYVIHKSNGGVSSARNAGIEVAKGDYIMFLDADDIISPDALGILSLNDADLVLGGFRKVIAGKTQYSRVPKYNRMYKGTDQICHFFDDNIGKKDCFMLNSSCFKLYRRKILQENSLRFDERLRYGEDKMFVFNYLKYITSIRTIDSVIYDYVYAVDSLSSDVKSDKHLDQVFLLLQSYIPLLAELVDKYPYSYRLSSLYHTDVISRYVMRILTCYVTRKTKLMTRENISLLYSYMKEDNDLTLFSVRPLQIPNILLQRLDRVGLTYLLYSFTSSICKYIFFK